ncbi:MAG TPA: MerR family transcriptional regulator [Mycobacteriales bacterium]
MKESDNPPPPGLTIDELARRVDMTVRNLREWRTLGLLPRARMRGRVGYYDESVVKRVGVVHTLRAEGFPLDLIRQMLETAGDSADAVLHLAERLRAPFRDEAAPPITESAWNRRWHTSNPAHVQRAIDVGLLRRTGARRLEYASARLATVDQTLSGLGLSVEGMLAALGAIRRHADGLAAVFEQVWRDEIWQPFLDKGAPEAALHDLQSTVEKLQPAALDAVVGLFVVAMDQRVAEGIAHEIEQHGGGAIATA